MDTNAVCKERKKLIIIIFHIIMYIVGVNKGSKAKFEGSLL